MASDISPLNIVDPAIDDGGVDFLFSDFETFYSQTYSLTKQDPASYILDPLFEAICLGCANMTGDPTLIEGPEIPQFVHRLRGHRQRTGRKIAMVSHNAQFDMSILSWHYDFRPDLIVDTIALSRTVLGPILASHSLDSVAAYFGLPAKGSVIKQIKGMTRLDIKACNLWPQLVEYCLHDTWLCREIFNRLFRFLPPDEIQLHDILTRCTVEPVLRVDRDLLVDHLARVKAQKAQYLGMIEQMGIGKTHLMSNQKFADVLRGLGVTPPMKTSPTTGEQTYAFAKNDEGFVELLEHPDILVRTVVEARLETKSTIEETRAQRFISISELPFPCHGSATGYMPMPVIIGAAHTHRVGGGWDLNVQNMGRDSRLRDAIHADDGCVLLVVDSSQIEARDTAWFCGQEDLLEEFRRKEDVYANFGSEIFGFKVTKANVPERFVGKTGILQLGYACGWFKFQRTVDNLSRKSDTPIKLTDWQAQDVVNKYRARMRRITGTWRELDHVLAIMHSLPKFGQGEGLSKKCVTFYQNLMIGPTGLPIHFPELHYKEEDGSWWFRDGKFWRRTYGASLLETIAQHVARCIVFGAAVRLIGPMANLGARLVHSAHDELVYMVPKENAAAAEIWAKTEMNRTPVWAAGLPLACETGVAVRYGEAK